MSLSKIIRSSAGRVISTWLVLILLRSPLAAQQLIWSDTYQGGLLVENYSRGTGNTPAGSFELPIPGGATIRKATLYGFELNGTDDPFTVVLNGTPYTFGIGTTATGQEYESVYGPVRLHALDLTTELDPTVSTYVINLPFPAQSFIGMVDVCMVVAYEQAGLGEMTADLFWCDQNSTTPESYSITTSAPMLTANPIAFGTMASYCDLSVTDCEEVTVNGTYLGRFAGPDHNAASSFGSSASFLYSSDEFIGLGTDTANMRINAGDALSELSTLVADQAMGFDVVYEHCGHPIPQNPQAQDNLMNLMVVAYSSDICTWELDLGPDTLLCTGGTLLLDATRPGATYLWQDGTTTSTFAVSAPGTYIVQLAHPSCTWEPDTIVIEYADVDIDLGPDQAICTGRTAMVYTQASDGVTYVWDDGEVGPAREVSADDTYVLTATFDHCSATDTITIRMEPCSLLVELPNIFTPNGDGTNAVFAPITMHGVRSMSISVYNRWGQELFTSTNLAFRWDGRSASGNAVPDGVYYWVLRYVAENGPEEELSQHGTVTITR